MNGFLVTIYLFITYYLMIVLGFVFAIILAKLKPRSGFGVVSVSPFRFEAGGRVS